MSEPIPSLAHDPAKCATCSGRRHRPEPNPIAEYLEAVADAIRQARQETP